MSVRIKSALMKVKNSDGEYVDLDTLAVTQTTQEAISEIESAVAGVQDIVDDAETRAATVASTVSAAETAITNLENQKNDIVQSVASMAELGTDTTLTVAGMAADAKATGDAVGELRGALGQSYDNLKSIGFDYNFVIGGLLQGELTTAKNRVSMDSIAVAQHDMLLNVSSGFRFGVHRFNNGVFYSDTGLSTNSKLIQKGTQFKISIARITEISSEVASIFEFTNAVTHISDIGINEKEINVGKDSQIGLGGGYETLWLKTPFICGGLNYGNINTLLYRVSSQNIISYDRTIKLVAENGFRFCVHYFNNGEYVRETPLSTSPVTVQANAEFKITIARITEDTTKIADVYEFCDKVHLQTKIKSEIESILKTEEIAQQITGVFIPYSMVNGSYSVTQGQLPEPRDDATRCRTALFSCDREDVFTLIANDGFKASVLFFDDDGLYIEQTQMKTGEYIGNCSGTKFAMIFGKNDNSAVLPEDLYGQVSVTFSNPHDGFVLGDYSDNPLLQMVAIYNGCISNARIGNNILASFDDVGYTNHDGTVVLHDDKLYCVYCRYANGSSGGDAASNTTAEIVLRVLDTNGNEISKEIIAKNGDSFGNRSITGGCGSPNMYFHNSALYILFTANVDGTFCQLVCSYEISTASKTIQPVLVNGDELNNAWIANNTDYVELTASAYSSAQANSTIASDGTNFYIGWVYGVNERSGAFVFRTTDFVNWNAFYKYTNNIRPCYEMPLVYNNGYLFYAVRPAYNVDYPYGWFGKIQISTQMQVDGMPFRNCSSRPAFFRYGGEVYFVTNPTDRAQVDIIRIDTASLLNSEIVATLYGEYNYPSFATDDTEYKVYVLTSNSGMRIRWFSPAFVNRAIVQNKMLELFDV